MTLDVSPVRPWEYGNIDAYEWNLAQEIQQAIRSGHHEAHEKQREVESRKREMAQAAQAARQLASR